MGDKKTEKLMKLKEGKTNEKQLKERIDNKVGLKMNQYGRLNKEDTDVK